MAIKDPLFIVHPTPADEYYKSQPTPIMGWSRRKEPRIEDVNRAHENLRKLVQEKDRIIQQSNGLVEALKRERAWRKLLVSAFVATWVTIIFVLKFLIPYAIKGMLR